MRKIIVTEFITLDGVVEAPGGSETNHPNAGWQYRDPEAGQYKMDELKEVDALLLGKNTYEQFAKYWPTQSGNGFADPINKYPKYVVSTSLQKAEWDTSHILRNIEDVAALKKTEGGNILVYGSATLVRSLFHHGLVDELRLLMYPVAVGGGMRIFDDNRDLNQFELKRAHTFDKGILLLQYQSKK
ncbi:dihydrofolate reductase family protein [Chitinophaga lutea]